ncbi:MAG: hypothetical protein IPF47_23510 [Gemmatimonadetes bacterium]|nr:hypothetical protein [Gemmatimonadota bacterium]
MRAALAAGGLLATLCPALLRAQERAIVLRGGTVVPVDGAPIPNGTVVMRGGKIVAVGANVAIRVGPRSWTCAASTSSPDWSTR